MLQGNGGIWVGDKSGVDGGEDSRDDADCLARMGRLQARARAVSPERTRERRFFVSERDMGGLYICGQRVNRVKLGRSGCGASVARQVRDLEAQGSIPCTPTIVPISKEL